jgi:hypothetical protein
LARKHPNLILLSTDGAVLGTIERDWHSEAKLEHPLHGLAARVGSLKPRSSAPETQCKFILGDFASLGEFLAHQLSPQDGNDEARRGS